MAKRWGDPAVTIADAELLYPQTALAIALLETGGFRSRWMMKAHNWFAFKTNRAGFQTGHRGAYGKYASPEAALADYRRFEQETCFRYGLHTEKQFRAWIVRHYAQDPAYAEKLNINLNLISPLWN